jgi:hypothetical protein
VSAEKRCWDKAKGDDELLIRDIKGDFPDKNKDANKNHAERHNRFDSCWIIIAQWNNGII